MRRARCPRRSSTARRGGCSRRRSSWDCSTRTGPRRARSSAAGTVDLDSPANRALARELAERSVILLDAGSALPLRGEGRPALRRVAVVGPCAADPRTFMGCYAFPNHVLPRHPGLGLGIEVPSALDALRAELADVDVVHALGCEVQGDDRSGSPRPSRRPGGPTSASPSSATSPGCSAGDVRGGLRRRRPPAARAAGRAARRSCWPPAHQSSSSSSPAGRTRWARCTAGRPGSCRRSCPARRAAGHRRRALRAGPAWRRLPVQIPRPPGGQPGTYLQPPLGADTAAPATSTRPRCSLRVRRSYTTFAVEDLSLDRSEIPTDGEFTAPTGDATPATARRRGGRAALPARRRRRWRGRCGSSPASPGSASSPARPAEVAFRVHADRTAFADRDLQRVVEPGDIEVLVGTSAGDLPCRAAYD